MGRFAPDNHRKARPMAIQRTFSIIKPDATARNLTGAINAKIEAAGLRIVAQKRIHLTKAQAGVFYGVHKERPFYDELCTFMSSAPIVAQVLEGENPVAEWTKGTWLKPMLDALDSDQRTGFEAAYRARIAAANRTIRGRDGAG